MGLVSNLGNLHFFFFFQAEDGIRDYKVTGVQTCALPIFFAPKASYAATGRHGMQVDEFKSLIKHMHLAGIEVVLDVVFNHTGEGNEWGPKIGRASCRERV